MTSKRMAISALLSSDAAPSRPKPLSPSASDLTVASNSLEPPHKRQRNAHAYTHYYESYNAYPHAQPAPSASYQHSPTPQWAAPQEQSQRYVASPTAVDFSSQQRDADEADEHDDQREHWRPPPTTSTGTGESLVSVLAGQMRARQMGATSGAGSTGLPAPLQLRREHEQQQQQQRVSHAYTGSVPVPVDSQPMSRDISPIVVKSATPHTTPSPASAYAPTVSLSPTDPQRFPSPRPQRRMSKSPTIHRHYSRPSVSPTEYHADSHTIANYPSRSAQYVPHSPPVPSTHSHASRVTSPTTSYKLPSSRPASSLGSNEIMASSAPPPPTPRVRTPPIHSQSTLSHPPRQSQSSSWSQPSPQSNASPQFQLPYPQAPPPPPQSQPFTQSHTPPPSQLSHSQRRSWSPSPAQSQPPPPPSRPQSQSSHSQPPSWSPQPSQSQPSSQSHAQPPQPQPSHSQAPSWSLPPQSQPSPQSYPQPSLLPLSQPPSHSHTPSRSHRSPQPQPSPSQPPKPKGKNGDPDEERLFEDELLSLVDGNDVKPKIFRPAPEAPALSVPSFPAGRKTPGSATKSKPKAPPKSRVLPPKSSKAKVATAAARHASGGSTPAPDSSMPPPSPPPVTQPTKQSPAVARAKGKTGGMNSNRKKTSATTRSRSLSVKPPDPTPAPIDVEITMQQDDRLYCLCKTPYEEDKIMIACDRCDEWYHPACVGMPELEVDLVDQFICSSCSAQNQALHTTYKLRCHRGLNHIPSQDSLPICWRPARGAFSKYCSDECGVTYMRAKLALTGRTAAELWPAVKNARRREGVTISHADINIKTEDSKTGVGDMDLDLEKDADVPQVAVRKAMKEADEREMSELRRRLEDVMRAREECKLALENVVTRRRLLDLAVDRAGARFCGWDARLEMGDREWEGWVSTDEGRRALDGEDVEDGAQWWCQGPEACPRHKGWQTVRDHDAQLEVDLKNASIKQLTDKERELRHRIEDLEPPSALLKPHGKPGGRKKLGRKSTH